MLILNIRFIVCLLTILFISGCINENIVTTRPEYAYPQNLMSLCAKESILEVSNKGEYVTSDYTNKSSQLLLSSQLVQLPTDVQRQISKITLNISTVLNISTELNLSNGKDLSYSIPASSLRCNDEAELVFTYPSESFYFWASVGNKSRELVLWTNSEGELIIQNRWRETQRGIVGGEITGDAWAIFKHVDSVQKAEEAPQPVMNNINSAAEINQCEALHGKFEPLGEAIGSDGSISERGAVEHFFREEIVGAQPVNQQANSATMLELIQEEKQGITINIYDSNGLLASRLLQTNNISCIKGRWEYYGEKKGHSAWLLLAASAGLYWEDMTLWLDANGDLLISGVYKTRGALLLVPFGRTEKTFVAFAKK